MSKKMRFTVSKRSLLGEVANYAVLQSPYNRPDDLEIVLDKFSEIINGEEYVQLSYSEIKELLDKLKTIPEFMKWNDRKNNNKEQYKFISRYSMEEDPDDDFIDLDALIRNVANSIIREDYQKSIPEILGEGGVEVTN